MNASNYHRDRVDYRADQRREAFNYAVDSLKRARHALNTAAIGEPSSRRADVFQRLENEVQAVLIELAALR